MSATVGPTIDGPPAIEIEHLTVSYGQVAALLDISVAIGAGQLVGIIGPNGSGKSTLVKAILGFLRPDIGRVRIFGQPLERATGRVAYVPQRGAVDWDFPVSVREVALMGRYGRIPWWRKPSADDFRAADEALETVRMAEYRDRLTTGKRPATALRRLRRAVLGRAPPRAGRTRTAAV